MQGFLQVHVYFALQQLSVMWGGGQFCLTGKVSSEEELYCGLIEARKTNEDVPKNSAASSNSCLVCSKMNNELSVSDGL